MSGLEVIGSITAVISIIDASVKIYDSARKDIKLSKILDTVERKLSLILDIPKIYKSNLEPSKSTMSEDACKVLTQATICHNQSSNKKQTLMYSNNFNLNVRRLRQPRNINASSYRVLHNILLVHLIKLVIVIIDPGEDNLEVYLALHLSLLRFYDRNHP